MPTLHLGEEFNKQLGIVQKVRHFNSSYQTDLNKLLKEIADTAEPGTILDIGDCRFDKASGNEISYAIKEYPNIRIVDSARPFNQKILDENYKRLSVNTAAFNTEILMPSDCTSMRSVLESAAQLDKSVKYVINRDYLTSSDSDSYEYYLIVILLLGRDIDINFSIYFRNILSKVRREITFDPECTSWFVPLKFGVMELSADSDGTYDLGPLGKVAGDMLFAHYMAVPAYLGKVNLLKKWEPLLKKCLTEIVVHAQEVKERTLFDIIQNRSEDNDTA